MVKVFELPEQVFGEPHWVVPEQRSTPASPVVGLPPSELAVVWRAADRREAVRVFVESCVRCLCA